MTDTANTQTTTATTSSSPSPSPAPSPAPQLSRAERIANTIQGANRIEVPETTASPEPTAAPTPDLQKPEPDYFADEFLATPEGIRAAKEKVRLLKEETAKAKREHDKAFLKLKSREQKQAKREAEKQAEWERKAQEQKFWEDNISQMQNFNDVEQFLQAMSNVTKKDPVELWEGIIANVAGRKKPDPAYLELQKKLEEIEKAQKEKEENLKKQQEKAEIEQEYNEAAGYIWNKAKEYPTLNKFMAIGEAQGQWQPAQEVVDGAIKLITIYYEHGQPITEEEALELLEQEIQSNKNYMEYINNHASILEGLEKTSDESQEPVAGRATSTSTNPGTVPIIGQTLTSTQISQQPTQRKMTYHEIKERNRNNPELLLRHFR